MPKKPKSLSEQSRRFIERAEEIGATASEDEFLSVNGFAVSGPEAVDPWEGSTDRHACGVPLNTMTVANSSHEDKASLQSAVS